MHCQKNEAECFICKKYGQVYVQPTPKGSGQDTSMTSSKMRKSSQPQTTSNGNTMPQKTRKSTKSKKSESGSEQDRVEKCIVGSCKKYYHFACMKINQNVDIYKNNKN